MILALAGQEHPGSSSGRLDKRSGRAAAGRGDRRSEATAANPKVTQKQVIGEGAVQQPFKAAEEPIVTANPQQSQQKESHQAGKAPFLCLSFSIYRDPHL